MSQIFWFHNHWKPKFIDALFDISQYVRPGFTTDLYCLKKDFVVTSYNNNDDWDNKLPLRNWDGVGHPIKEYTPPPLSYVITEYWTGKLQIPEIIRASSFHGNCPQMI